MYNVYNFYKKLGDIMKTFNITGICYPEYHYMVKMEDNLRKFEELIDKGTYFCINRGRQYGKTTTLNLIKNHLQSRYDFIFLSFEGLSNSTFSSESQLYKAFFKMLMKKNDNTTLNYTADIEGIINELAKRDDIDSMDFSAAITDIIKFNSKPIILIIDEVDQASNFEVFIKFLGELRRKFLTRLKTPTFQSVVIAGVYDLKNLKSKIRPEDEHKYNSPWNIAIQFSGDMSLPVAGIADMLRDYAYEHNKSINVDLIAKLLRDYTSGYPFLVSRICQIIDEDELNWNKEGFLTAVKLLLTESNTLFDDIARKVEYYPNLRNILYDILFYGSKYPFNRYDKHVNLAIMFNYLDNNEGLLKISNRIFETWMYNLFIAEAATNKESKESSIYKEGSIDKNIFIINGQLNMPLILEKFALHFNDIYGKNDFTFLENMGRKLFLLYLRPIINGVGNYYIEAQTRDETRTDVIVDYAGKQYIIELKIWRGNAYNERGEKQLAEYLDFFHQKEGYLISFNFNKNKNSGIVETTIDDKKIIEVIV